VDQVHSADGGRPLSPRRLIAPASMWTRLIGGLVFVYFPESAEASKPHEGAGVPHHSRKAKSAPRNGERTTLMVVRGGIMHHRARLAPPTTAT
jgi:hypothetical protein